MSLLRFGGSRDSDRWRLPQVLNTTLMFFSIVLLLLSLKCGVTASKQLDEKNEDKIRLKLN